MLVINDINLFQHSVVLHIEISHLICTANQMAGFYVKCNTGLKWIKQATSVLPNITLIAKITHLKIWKYLLNVTKVEARDVTIVSYIYNLQTTVFKYILLFYIFIFSYFFLDCCLIISDIYFSWAIGYFFEFTFTSETLFTLL